MPHGTFRALPGTRKVCSKQHVLMSCSGVLTRTDFTLPAYGGQGHGAVHQNIKVFLLPST